LGYSPQEIKKALHMCRESQVARYIYRIIWGFHLGQETNQWPIYLSWKARVCPNLKPGLSLFDSIWTHKNGLNDSGAARRCWVWPLHKYLESLELIDGSAYKHCCFPSQNLELWPLWARQIKGRENVHLMLNICTQATPLYFQHPELVIAALKISMPVLNLLWYLNHVSGDSTEVDDTSNGGIEVARWNRKHGESGQLNTN
jgi:hypothetical protein